MYQRLTLSTPRSVRWRRKMSHASTVYSEFSLRTKAPAAVAAHVSISEIWMKSY